MWRSGRGRRGELHEQQLPALFRNSRRYRRSLTNTARGVAVVETSDDPRVTAIRSHAAEVTGFVDDGMPAMMADAAGARAAVFGGVPLGDPELADELLQPRVGRRAEPKLESPRGYHDRRRDPGVGGQVDVPGAGAPAARRQDALAAEEGAQLAHLGLRQRRLVGDPDGAVFQVVHRALAG